MARERDTNAWCLPGGRGCHTPVNQHRAGTIRPPETPLTAARPPLPLLLLAAALLIATTAHANETADAKAKANALHAQYFKQVKYTDFATFSKRMAAIRALGELDCEPARKHLLADQQYYRGQIDPVSSTKSRVLFPGCEPEIASWTIQRSSPGSS